MPETLYARPSHIAALTASWQGGATADADYPVAQAATLEPDVVAKANENTGTLRATLTAGAAALSGLAYLNVSFRGTSATLSNANGMTPQVKTVPDPEDDGVANIFFDLRGVTTSSAVWDLAITGTSPIGVGSIVPVLTWEAFRLQWGFNLRDPDTTIEHWTSYRKRITYEVPVTVREFTATSHDAADLEILRSLRREAKRSVLPWLFVPEASADLVLLVQFAKDDARETFTFYRGAYDEGQIQKEIRAIEVSAGVPL